MCGQASPWMPRSDSKSCRPKLPLVSAMRRLQSPIEKPTGWKKFCFYFPKNVAYEALRLDIGP